MAGEWDILGDRRSPQRASSPGFCRSRGHCGRSEGGGGGSAGGSQEGGTCCSSVGGGGRAGKEGGDLERPLTPVPPREWVPSARAALGLVLREERLEPVALGGLQRHHARSAGTGRLWGGGWGQGDPCLSKVVGPPGSCQLVSWGSRNVPFNMESHSCCPAQRPPANEQGCVVSSWAGDAHYCWAAGDCWAPSELDSSPGGLGPDCSLPNPGRGGVRPGPRPRLLGGNGPRERTGMVD